MIIIIITKTIISGCHKLIIFFPFQEQALGALKLTNGRGDSVFDFIGKQAQMQQLQHQQLQEAQSNGHPQKVSLNSFFLYHKL